MTAPEGTHRLRCATDAMAPLILRGDELTVRAQETAEDGQVVVATVNGETVVRRYRIDGDSVRLVAEDNDDAWSLIYFRPDEVVVVGVVLSLYREIT